jgi:hypothetical protein
VDLGLEVAEGAVVEEVVDPDSGVVPGPALLDLNLP